MLESFKKTIYADFPDIENRQIYLAISGGKDSMVLSNLLLRSKLNHTLLHCNFNLRGKESDEDEKFLRDYASSNHLFIKVKSFNTIKVAEKRKLTIQEAARNLRYEWFKTHHNGKSIILTAHHLDDSIESFFINLLRGTGYKGISGIPKFNPPFYRPLLQFKVDEIYEYIDKNGLEYRKDSSNAEMKYLRNKLRHGILSQILDIEPNFKTKMHRFFVEMNELTAFLDEREAILKRELFEISAGLISVELKHIKNFDPFTFLILFKKHGLHRSNISGFQTFLNSSTGSVFKTRTHDFLINRDFLEIRSNEIECVQINETVDDIPTRISIDRGTIHLIKKSADKLSRSNSPIQLAAEKVNFPVNIRTWKPGDRISPLGMTGSKLISDILIDKKLSRFQKQNVLVLVDANTTVIALLDFMISEDVKCDNETSELIEIWCDLS